MELGIGEYGEVNGECIRNSIGSDTTLGDLGTIGPGFSRTYQVGKIGPEQYETFMDGLFTFAT